MNDRRLLIALASNVAGAAVGRAHAESRRMLLFGINGASTEFIASAVPGQVTALLLKAMAVIPLHHLRWESAS